MISIKRKLTFAVLVTSAIILSYVLLQEQKIKELIELDDIMDIDQQKLTENDKIFFIESHIEHIRNFSKFKFACSIESAAKINPNLQVHLLFATTSKSVKLSRSNIVDALLSYENINLMYIDVIKFARGTVLENFMKNSMWKRSRYPVVHLSDILRPLVLNKYGGLYLDLDVLFKTSLSEINRTNFACTQNDGLVVNNIMRLDLEQGKSLTGDFLKKIANEFDGSSWIGKTATDLTFR
ncbi:unnamed protein product [Chironomus riparius]|uniref:Alpha-1,4-N-acetylglucosaminyltransferase n=1 Tax=Chironomus riparius TaxID=315576 RepID=A0A9P0JB90_9DIPT|nr:unnamed protein product [Chironomus riparius]